MFLMLNLGKVDYDYDRLNYSILTKFFNQILKLKKSRLLPKTEINTLESKLCADLGKLCKAIKHLGASYMSVLSFTTSNTITHIITT